MEIKHYVDIEVVKWLMKEKGIDEKKLAELMKVTSPTVKRLLNGANQEHMTILTAFKIARALGTNIPTILKKD